MNYKVDDRFIRRLLRPRRRRLNWENIFILAAIIVAAIIWARIWYGIALAI